MELEEMKSLWSEMSLKIENQKKLTDSLIIKMTKMNYNNKINKIAIPETIGSLGCFAMAFYILSNLQKLNTWYLLTCGIAAAAILLTLGVLSLRAIRKIKDVNIGNDFKESLIAYSKAKIQFVSVQKLTFYLGAILLVTSLPVMGMLIGGKDFFITTKLWLWYAVSYPFFHVFARWVFKSYVRKIEDAENILKDLKD